MSSTECHSSLAMQSGRAMMWKLFFVIYTVPLTAADWCVCSGTAVYCGIADALLRVIRPTSTTAHCTCERRVYSEVKQRVTVVHSKGHVTLNSDFCAIRGNQLRAIEIFPQCFFQSAGLIS